jgi:hypothetical protein
METVRVVGAELLKFESVMARIVRNQRSCTEGCRTTVFILMFSVASENNPCASLNLHSVRKRPGPAGCQAFCGVGFSNGGGPSLRQDRP